MIVLVVLLLLGAFAFVRLRVGYSQPAVPYAVLAPGDAAFLKAAAETFFPAAADDEGGGGRPPGLLAGADVDLGGYMDDYLQQLPSRQRILIRALLVLFEQSTVLWPARGPGAFRRFSGMSPEQRLHVLHGWEHSRLYLRRVAFTALKAVLVLGYLGDEANLRALGLAPWEIESPVIESDLIYPPIGGRPEEVGFTLDDLPAPGEAPAPAVPLRGAEASP